MSYLNALHLDYYVFDLAVIWLVFGLCTKVVQFGCSMVLAQSCGSTGAEVLKSKIENGNAGMGCSARNSLERG